MIRQKTLTCEWIKQKYKKKIYSFLSVYKNADIIDREW